MLGLLNLGGPLIELGFRLLMWFYIAPLTLALIGLGFMRDSVRVLVARNGMDAPVRRATARYLAGQGVLGLVAAVLVFLAIFYRKELLQCVIGVF